MACPTASADPVGLNRHHLQNSQKGFIPDNLAGSEQEEGYIALLFIINNFLTFVL